MVCNASLLEKGAVIFGCRRKLHMPERNELRKLMLGRGGGVASRREVGSEPRGRLWRGA